MNKSMEMSSSASHHLPKISKINDSLNLNNQKNGLSSDRYRAQSTTEINVNVSLTRKLVSMDDIRNV